MSSLKRIIWLQSIFSEDFLKKSLAASPAANLWQYEFIKSLKKKKIEFFCVGHNPEPAFPKGKFFIKTLKKDLVSGIQNKSFEYVNLPYLRDIILKKKYYNYLKNFHFKKGDIILTYNDSFLSDVALKLKNKFNLPWISIVADLKSPDKSSGYVYLNWEYYKKDRISHKKICIDGGIKSSSTNLNLLKKNKIILYAGTIGGHAGVSYLIKAFNYIKEDKVELWLCGKGNYQDIKSLVSQDKRIKFKGYVQKSKLEKLCNKADILVNPRQADGNNTNFPSKILFYLSFNKPIISTKSGLGPKYKDVIFLLRNEKIKTLTSKINQVLSLNTKQKKKVKKKIAKFTNENSWDKQTNKFFIWINKKIKFYLVKKSK